MNTAFLLLAQYERAAIPADIVCRDYFAPMTLPVFLRKLGEGEIDLVVTRMGVGQKAPRVVAIQNLASLSRHPAQPRSQGTQEAPVLSSSTHRARRDPKPHTCH